MDLLPLTALFNIMNSIYIILAIMVLSWFGIVTFQNRQRVNAVLGQYLHPRSYLCTSQGVCKYSVVVALLVFLWVGLVVCTMKVRTEPVVFSKSRGYEVQSANATSEHRRHGRRHHHVHS
jgi:low affinity Fe/Cu permease